jgi:hypothetical protein
MYRQAFRLSVLLIHRRPIPQHAPAVQPIAAPCAEIAGVTLDGVYDLTFNVLHDAHMLDAAVAVPVEKNDVAGVRDIAAARVLSKPTLLEPRNTLTFASGKLGQNPRVDIPALVGAP